MTVGGHQKHLGDKAVMLLRGIQDGSIFDTLMAVTFAEILLHVLVHLG